MTLTPIIYMPILCDKDRVNLWQGVVIRFDHQLREVQNQAWVRTQTLLEGMKRPMRSDRIPDSIEQYLGIAMRKRKQYFSLTEWQNKVSEVLFQTRLEQGVTGKFIVQVEKTKTTLHICHVQFNLSGLPHDIHGKITGWKDKLGKSKQPVLKMTWSLCFLFLSNQKESEIQSWRERKGWAMDGWRSDRRGRLRPRKLGKMSANRTPVVLTHAGMHTCTWYWISDAPQIRLSFSLVRKLTVPWICIDCGQTPQKPNA